MSAYFAKVNAYRFLLLQEVLLAYMKQGVLIGIFLLLSGLSTHIRLMIKKK